ncbi:MAG: hypothetical protein E4G99_08415 [Anaerolineales bacterium]|nr:MAG: hypothetical protein E4G99_08415 [Anaerolineales bacterium]
MSWGMMPGQIEIDARDRENSCLQVYLFGHPQITWQGQQILIPRARVRAIFYYLSIRPHTVARSELCYLFWPDIPDRTARRNLSHLLTHLRRALPLQLILTEGRNQITLDHNQIFSDVHNFEKICQQALVSMKTSDLEHAASIWSHPFLSGCELAHAPNFDDWVTRIRLEHEKAILNVLRVLVERYFETSRYQQAITAATSFLEIDPLVEDMHRTLIKLFTLIGDYSSAIRQFRLCAAILHAELEIEPSTETWACYRSIQDKMHEQARNNSPIPSAIPPRRMEIPFVGRQNSLAGLSMIFEKTHLAGSSVFFISGEPGIGKTALLTYFTSTHKAEATFLSGAGSPGAENIPYLTILQAFRSCHSLEQGLMKLAPRYQDMAALILPETRRHMTHSSPSILTIPEDAQSWLFEALWQILVTLHTHNHPIILCIDDLHWTDKASMACLAYFFCRTSNVPFKMVATCRTEQAQKVSELRHQLIRRGLLNEILLEGLSIAAIKEITDSVECADDDSDALPRQLQQISGGNPFFLSETLAAIHADPRPIPMLQKLSSLELPSSLSDAILRRLCRLPTIERQILEAGAVLGTEFDVELLRYTSGHRELETLDALERLTENQIFGSRGSTYHFRHNLLQRVALENIKPARKRILNRRAGNAMVTLQRRDPTRTAQYFLNGGETHQAIQHFTLAADQYQAAFAWREAEIHTTQCLDLLQPPIAGWTPDEILEKKVHLLSQRARLRQLHGDIPGRKEDIQAMAAVEHAFPKYANHLSMTIDQIHYLNLDAEHELARDLGENTLRHGNPHKDPSAWLRLLIEVGTTHYEIGHPQRALEVFTSALDNPIGSLDDQQQGQIHHFLGRLHSHLGQIPEALLHLEHALHCHTDSGDQKGLFSDHIQFCSIHLKLGNIEVAEEYLRRAAALCSRYASPSVEIHKLCAQATLDLYRGAYAQASTTFFEAWDLHDSLYGDRKTAPPEPLICGWSLTQLHLANSRPAISRLESAIEVCHCRQRGGILITLGLHQLAIHRPRKARTHFNEAINLAKHTCERAENHALGQAGLARASRMLKQSGQAIAEARQAVEVAADLPFAHCKIWAFFEYAYAYHLDGQPDQALTHVLSALDLAGDHHQAWLGNESIYELYGRLLEASGAARAAESALRTAHEIRNAKAAAIPDAARRQAYLQAGMNIF